VTPAKKADDKKKPVQKVQQKKTAALIKRPVSVKKLEKTVKKATSVPITTKGKKTGSAASSKDKQKKK